MCGILGVFFYGSTNVMQANFLDALAQINHRGPDDQGHELLISTNNSNLLIGHTRLSILDLSQAGHQPMNSFDRKLTIIYNGEIYNYKEVRTILVESGYKFETETDTEVLLNAFHLWGIKCLEMLKGMFAFAIYNHYEKKLTLARDAFGIKPFFYIEMDGKFIFASEIAPIITLLKNKPELNLQTVYEYLIHGEYDRCENTFFRGIKHLMPASFIEFDCDSATLSEPEKWWAPNIKESTNIGFEQAVAIVRQMFLDNVKLHLRSDVPLGATLSGGIDSSAIVCAMRHLYPDMPIHTFSYIAKGTEKSEEKWVDIVNKHAGAVAHKIEVSPDDLTKDLKILIKSQGEPFGSTSIYAQFKVLQEAKKQQITVSLDGQGADELLAGYYGYPGERILSLLETSSIRRALSFTNNWSKFPGRSRIKALMHFGRTTLPDLWYGLGRMLTGKQRFTAWINATMFRDAGVNIKENRLMLKKTARGRRVLERMAFSLENRGLPALLRHGDRNSMFYSIESRVPFLTTQFVDFLYSLPESYLISMGGKTKHVFREAMRGIVPDVIIDRKDKIGFETYESDWDEFLNLQIVKEYRLLEKTGNRDVGLLSRIDYDSIRKVSVKQKWRILNFLVWLGLY